MKILKAILPLFTLVFLLGCSNDDSGGGDDISAELVGTWQLSETNVSEAIDTNDDGTTTTNLMTEVDCLEDTLVLSADASWSSSGVFPANISPITGNLYNVSCSSVIVRGGNWGFSGSSLFLSGDFQATFLYDGTRLTLPIGNDLPGIQSLVYVRQ